MLRVVHGAIDRFELAHVDLHGTRVIDVTGKPATSADDCVGPHILGNVLFVLLHETVEKPGAFRELATSGRVGHDQDEVLLDGIVVDKWNVDDLAVFELVKGPIERGLSKLRMLFDVEHTEHLDL
jgi:hypothetical protein